MPEPPHSESLGAGVAAGTDRATRRVQRVYEKMAPRYDRVMGVADRLVFTGGRDWVCRRARGATLEVAVGTGRNLGRYPDDVELRAIELSPAMLEIARRRARSLGVEAELQEGDAQRLGFDDASFDTLLCTLALCTVPDDVAALIEMVHVLRPGGRLLLLEHTASPCSWGTSAPRRGRAGHPRTRR